MLNDEEILGFWAKSYKSSVGKGVTGMKAKIRTILWERGCGFVEEEDSSSAGIFGT